MLHINKLSVGYVIGTNKTKIILPDSNAYLQRGQLVALLGANGAGKSTLLRTLSGLQKPITGSVWLDDKNIHEISASEIATKISIVLTETTDIGYLTVGEMTLFGRYPYTNWAGQFATQDHEKAQKALSLMGIADLAATPLRELSDGQRQKVFIARALAQNGELLILDEPTAHLDVMSRMEMMTLLRNIAIQEQKMVLIATHDVEIALQCADIFWLATRNESLRCGSPESLVLKGSFSSLFKHNTVFFNENKGIFETQKIDNGNFFSITGNELACFWTQRALEKHGLVCINRADLHIEVDKNNNEYRWQIKNQYFEDLENLVAYCQKIK